MKQFEKSENEKFFASNPKAAENYSLLRETGVVDHIESLDRELRYFRGLFSGALDISGRLSTEEIIDAAARHISDNFEPSWIVFLWKAPESREDVITRSYGNLEPLESGFGAESMGVFEPFFRPDFKPLRYGALFSGQDKTDTIKKIDSLGPELVIPLPETSGPYGLALLGRKSSGDEYAEDELEFLEKFTAFVSRALENRLRRERTLRNEKTGLFDNGFFLTRLNEEIARSVRSGSAAALVMIEIDCFREINNSRGQPASDRVLEDFAITLKQAVRAGDIPSRFGGERFAILLPDTDRDGAWFAAERLRNLASGLKVQWEPPLPRMTISLGVFSFGKDTGLSAEEIIRRAGEALSRSGERGRDCTAIWGAGLFNKIIRMNPGDQSFPAPQLP